VTAVPDRAPAARFGFSEDTVRLAVALRPALAPAASPNRPSSTTAPPLSTRGCRARARCWASSWSTPRRPQRKGKIERFFRTVRGQFLAEITAEIAWTLSPPTV